MKVRSFLFALAFISAALTAQKSFAQDGPEEFILPRTSTKAVVQQTIASTRIIITYNRPTKRGRVIFGELVPYDQVWRTGADEATEIFFSTPVILEGHSVDSGRYELFTVPGQEEWEIILQKNQDQWGSYRYDPANDAARFSVTPVSSEKTTETFTISVDDIGPDRGVLNISWDDVVVPVGINIDLKSTVIPGLEKALQQDGRRPYFQAAMFYFENDLDIDRAAELMALALEQRPDHIGMLYRYALILKQKGDIPEAIEAAQKSLDAAGEVGPELKEEYTRLNSNLLDELRSMKK